MSYLNRENHLNISSTSTYNTSSQESINHEYISILNDWDLDAAFLNSSNPYLSVNVELAHPEEIKTIESPKQAELKNEKYLKNKFEQERLENIGEYEEWDVITVNDIKSNQKIKDQNWKYESLDKKQQSKQEKASNLNKSKSYNFLNLDPNGRSLIALWSNSAADKAVSVFQKVLNGISRSGSFIINSGNKNSPPTLNNNYLSCSNLYNQVPKNQHVLNLFDLKLIEKEIKFKPPLNDNELKNFLDSDGRIVSIQELRQRIFEGGCDPNKRKELWPLLLDIFPSQNMTQRQREDYIKQKSTEYEQLKATLWYNSNKTILNKSNQFQSMSDYINNANYEYESSLYALAHKIHKDVWRTDRNHRFFSGDSNKNIESLFNILMTYSLANNGNNAYAQGMSDLLSPLLFVLRDEALTYICFCSLIKRCMSNLDVLSDPITTKINLLSSLLIRYDPYLWNYLTQVGADQLMFVYRWLLIECKREFPFNDSLCVLEVMWSTINPSTSASKPSGANQTNDFLNNYSYNRYDRSNSNASSISSRLLRQIANPNYCGNDDLLISNDDDEFSDILESSSNSARLSHKSRHQSQNSNNLNNNNKNDQASICEFCLAEKSPIINFKNINKNRKKSNPTTSSVSSPSSSNDQSQQEDNIGNDFSNRIEIFRNKNLAHKSLNNKLDLTSLSDSQVDDEDDSDSESDLSSKDNKYNFYYNFSRPKPRFRYFSLNSSFKSNQNKHDNVDDGDDEDNEKRTVSKSNSKMSSFSYTNSHDKHLRKRLINSKRTRYNLNLKKFNKLEDLNKLNKKRNASTYCLNKSIKLDKRFSYSCNILNEFDSKENKQDERNSIKCLANKKYAFNQPNSSMKNSSTTAMSISNARCSTSDAETITQQNILINSLNQQLSFSPKSPLDSAKTSLNGELENKLSTPSFTSRDKLSRFGSSKKPKILYKSIKNSAKHLINKKIKPTKTDISEESIEQKFNLKNSNEKKPPRKLKSKIEIEARNLNEQNTLENPSKKSVCCCSNSSSLDERNVDKKINRDLPVLVINSPEPSINTEKFDSNKINSPATTTSSKSSTSAYVSATSGASLMSSMSSSCSTPFLKQSGFSKPISIGNHQIINGNALLELNKHSSNTLSNQKTNFDDEEEEELIYSLSKLDNPFLLFMCLAIFFENRDYILKNQMDANDIACYFDKMTRKHNMKNILTRARYLYTKLYLSKANVFNYIHHVMEIQNSP